MTKDQIIAMERENHICRLLDAVPDLVKTLETVDAYLAPNGDDDDIWHEIRAIIQAAIAKAKGA